MLLHALVTALVLALGLSLGLTPAAATLGALAFAVHPVHVEAVANVAGRAELLSTAFALAALCVYARARRTDEPFPTSAALALAVLLGCAAFAKENVVTIVGVVGLWEIQHVKRVRDAARPVVAALAPVVFYITARWLVLGGVGLVPGAVTPIENPVVGLSPLSHAATVLAVFGRAASLILTPVRLSPDYGYAEFEPWPSLLTFGPLVGATVLLALLATIAASWRRAPLVAFLIASALVTYAITSNIVIQIGTVLGDRLLYLPSVFACLLAGIATAVAAQHLGRKTMYGAAGAILALLAARSHAYAQKWKDDATLFEYASRVAPNSVRNLGSWGVVLAERGRLPEARAVFDRAVVLAPDFIPNRLNRGAAALAAGELDIAATDARHVLELAPDNPEAKRLLDEVERRRFP